MLTPARVAGDGQKPLNYDRNSKCSGRRTASGPVALGAAVVGRSGAGGRPVVQTRAFCGASPQGPGVLVLDVQQGEGVADALFEQFIGELPVGEGSGEL